LNILCYGDSNTLGWDPRSFFGDLYERPWPVLLSEHPAHQVRIDAACGREIPKGRIAFPPDAELLILMLGTNDLLQGANAEEAARRMERFLTTFSSPEVLLIAPPPLRRGEWVSDEILIARSCRLAEEYRRLARDWGIRFLDSGEWSIPVVFDGVHFTEEGHRRFAENLMKYIFRLFPNLESKEDPT
jgi:lysophospholipase L1-like esterase